MNNGSGSLKLKSFKDYYFGTIFRPRRTFEALLSDDRSLKFGFLAISINAVLYSLVYIYLSMSGAAPSSFTPFLAILANVYYQYDRFILAPIFGRLVLLLDDIVRDLAVRNMFSIREPVLLEKG
jgi:hypothetical protein